MLQAGVASGRILKIFCRSGVIVYVDDPKKPAARRFSWRGALVK
ncbi:MAG: hypothetical protein ACXWYD_16625 [Candidatus Binatia bacterium]